MDAKCIVCGGQATDMHHVQIKGMGGTKDTDVLADVVPLCRLHHGLITDEKIKLTREEGRWVCRMDNVILMRRPITGIDPSEAGDWARLVREQGRRVVEQIPFIADDDAIRGIFEAATELQTAGYAIECEAIWELYQRAPGSGQAKLRMVAVAVNRSESFVYNRLRSRQEFGAGLQDLDSPDMLPTHIQIAATAADPQAAVAAFQQAVDAGATPSVKTFRQMVLHKGCAWKGAVLWCKMKDTRATDELCDACEECER